MNTSYWERETFLEHWDVVVVGAGIAGLSTAIELKKRQPNMRVTVLERSWLSDGASSKNAGFACFGSISEFIDDLQDIPFNEVVELAVRRYRGIEKLVSEYGVDALKLEWSGGHEVFFKEDEESFNGCVQHVEAFNEAFEMKLGIRPYEVLKVDAFQGMTNLCGVISNKYEGGLNTGAMLNALRNKAFQLGVQVFNGVEITGYFEQEDEMFLQSSVGDWKTKRVAFCTSAFHSHLFSDLKMSSKRNQVIVTKPIEGLMLDGTFHHHKGYNYFRNIDGRILMGGMRHLFPNTENTDIQGNTKELVKSLSDFIQTKVHTYSTIEIDLAWSGILGVGLDERPVVKQISNCVFVGARLGGIGVAIGSLIGEELAVIITDSFSK